MKKFVEISHAIEQQHAGMFRFDAEILLHHRGVSGDFWRAGGLVRPVVFLYKYLSFQEK